MSDSIPQTAHRAPAFKASMNIPRNTAVTPLNARKSRIKNSQLITLTCFAFCTLRSAVPSSVDGKALILRISVAGEVLGLPANVTGTCYELTAEVLDPTQSKFISRDDFLAFLKDNGEAALRVAQQLGETYHMAIAQMCTIDLSHSAGEKLARFLLQLAVNYPEAKGRVRMKLTLTHEEIGQLIGLSREPVTRLVADFRKNQWLQVTGSTLIIKNRSALQSFIDGVGS